jgi:TonB family protein
MAALITLASVGSECGRVKELPVAARQVRSRPCRHWPAAVAALCAFALGALSSMGAQAQQEPQPPQPQEAPPVVTAPSPSAAVSSETTSWKQSLVTRLAAAQLYPAKPRGVQGVVSVAFTIDRHGDLVSSRIVKSSGSTVLDAEAIDLIKRAAPLPAPPADIPDSDLSFVVPIRFAPR